jgi:hypothetical protein
MVVQMQEQMKQMFDAWADGIRGAMDSNQKTQAAWFDTFGDANKNNDAVKMFAMQPKELAREWWPCVGKNMHAMADAVDANFRAGMGVVEAVCDATMTADEGDVYEKAREVWDAAFDAARTHVDALGKAGKLTFENWAQFCENARTEGTASKSTSKPTAK